MKDYQYLQQRYIVNTYPNRGLTIVSGNGAYLYDVSGVKYLDMMSNYGVNIFGYNNLKINEVLINQLQKLTNLHGSFTNDIRAQASEGLIKKCGQDYFQVYWSNSGAEAIEAALKFSILATGKKRFIACKRAYHGKTLGALSVTYGEKYRQPFEPLLWNFCHIEYNNVDQLEKVIDRNTAAFIIEPIQGDGGINIPDSGYLKKVREICDKNNTFLIFDEIQSGTGRTGKFLASFWDDVSADILCLGKGLAGGLPVGATIINKKVAYKIPKLSHTSTFGGNPLTCAGALTSINLLDDVLLNHVQTVGQYFLASLRKIKSRLINDIRGKGLIIGIEVKDKRNDILKKLQENKILAIPASDNIVRFLPPYIIQKEHIVFVIQKLKKIFNELYI
jgi:acetylornithine/LysW-gamma-L-lysine aminotransferase